MLKYFSIRLFCLGLLSSCLLPGLIHGQTVSITSVSSTHFCTGDPVSVTFDVTGFWGHKNAFTLQISDVNGSFSSTFTNLASTIDTLPGTFTIASTIPDGFPESSHYRFRVLAAIPYKVSPDNGSDLTISAKPVFVTYTSFSGNPVVGDTIIFAGEYAGDDSVDVNFGDGGNRIPINYISDTIYVTYTTPGKKTIITTVIGKGGCTSTDTTYVVIGDSNTSNRCLPLIPHDAIVWATMDSTSPRLPNGVPSAVWVNPGIALDIDRQSDGRGNGDTIFAEAGSSISGGINCLIYLKPGSSYDGTNSYQNIIVAGDGTSVTNAGADKIIHCTALNFDYSTAPPNLVFPASVKGMEAVASIQISPNPSTGALVISGLPMSTQSLSVANILGQNVVQFQAPRSQKFTIDLSHFQSGVYYVRIASANSVVTKKIVKE